MTLTNECALTDIKEENCNGLQIGVD